MKDIQPNLLYSEQVLSGYEQNRMFYLGDHWQDSRGYIGQLPPVSNKNFADTIYAIRRGFISENVCKEVVDAHLAGLARNPDWQFTNGEKKLTDAVDAVITEWFDDREILTVINETAKNILTETTTLVRLFVPYGYLEAGGLPEVPTLAGAALYPHFEVVTREKGGVYRDEAKLLPFSVYNYSRKVGRRDINYAEVSFTDKLNLTHLITFADLKTFEPEHLLEAARLFIGERAVEEISNEGRRLYAKIDEDKLSDPVDLGGHLYLFEVTGAEFITEQIRSLQKIINLARTMGGKNINIAGVRQRDYMNAKKPDVVATGASANFLYGIPIQNEKGETIGLTSPNVSITDPSDPSYFIKTRDDAYAAILGQCGQRYRLMANDGRASGVSRVEARSEFISSLMKTAASLDKFGKWLMESFLYFAAAHTSENVDALKYRCVYRTVIDAGSVDTETRALDQLDVRENRLSVETYLSNVGIEDAPAELARIKDNPPVIGQVTSGTGASL